MSTIHFLNVYEGDCNIIQHDSGRTTVIDVSNADDHQDTPAEAAMKASEARKLIRERNYVPSDKQNYGQKHLPDNPIDYLKKLNTQSIFRFIVTHPDMDHIDGIRDFFNSFPVFNVWDTDNKKGDITSGGGYNEEDWQFYKGIRDQTNKAYSRKTYTMGTKLNYFDLDNITILAPTTELIKQAIELNDYNDSSYVLLYTPPKKNGGIWKILFAGDSHDKTWNMILNDVELKELVTNIDILFAPHHGRDSNRNYEFLNTLSPKVTLFGNASSEHLAYNSYKPLRITNNQAGYVIIDITQDALVFYCRNEEFAINFTHKRGWAKPLKSINFDAFPFVKFNA